MIRPLTDYFYVLLFLDRRLKQTRCFPIRPRWIWLGLQSVWVPTYALAACLSAHCTGASWTHTKRYTAYDCTVLVKVEIQILKVKSKTLWKMETSAFLSKNVLGNMFHGKWHICLTLRKKIYLHDWCETVLNRDKCFEWNCSKFCIPFGYTHVFLHDRLRVRKHLCLPQLSWCGESTSIPCPWTTSSTTKWKETPFV